MSFHEQTKEQIAKILQEAFKPSFLEVINDSASHAGHASARESGGGHFKIIMTSELFTGISPVKRHRMVYENLNNLMDSHIHAISMTLSAPGE